MLSFLKKGKESKGLVAFISGKVIPIEEVKDGVFSEKMLGDGLAIEPTGNVIISPCDGVISTVMEDSKHAVGITTKNGVEILIHEGLDTVSLEGEGFQLFVKQGQKVKRGDRLIQFDDKLLNEKKLAKTCIMVVTNSEEHPEIKYITGMEAVAGETIVAEK